MSNSSPAPRFQFSLRWLLISVAVVAVVLGLATFTIGQAFIGLLLAILLRGVFPTIAVISAIYGRGELRTFAIGAVVCSIPVVTSELGPMNSAGLIVGTISQLMAMGLCGVVAVATHRWLARHGLLASK
jgi:hypothetical protein